MAIDESPRMKPRLPDRTMILIPAFNEEGCIRELLAEVRQACPGIEVVVVNDGSSDQTVRQARSGGATVLDLPCNVGVGGAVQAGFQYAVDRGYDRVVRIDGDGQHPPAGIPRLIAAMDADRSDLVIGSRFGSEAACISTRFRYLGVRTLALFLSMICRRRITDPTSGFWLIRRPLLDYFARYYPADYPEPEAVALLRRQGYQFSETPVPFRPRTTGRSSIRAWGTFYYVFKVGLALVVDRLRPVDERYSRKLLAGPE